MDFVQPTPSGDVAALDALLAESQSNIAEQTLDLDDLLLESVNLAKDDRAGREAAKRLAKGGLSAKEMAEDRAKLVAWEMRHVWKPEANVARFIESGCSRCGDYEYLFTGLMQRQSHRHFPDQQRRFVAVDVQTPGLPNEIMTVEQHTPFCSECSEQVGFDWATCPVYTQDGVELEFREGEVEETDPEPADPQIADGDDEEETDHVN